MFATGKAFDNRRLIFRLLIPLLLVFGSVFAMSGSVLAAESSEEELKTAFIYNFLRYTEWPDESDKKYLKVTYLGDNPRYFKPLTSLVELKIRDIPIKVVQKTTISDLLPSDVIVIDEQKHNLLRQVNSLIKDKPVLVVTDRANEKQLFGINFISKSANRIAFELNRYNLVYQKLKVSSDIVILGGSEIEIASLIKDMESDLSRSRGALKNVQNQVEEKQRLLDKQGRQLNQQQSRLENLDKTIQQQKSAFDQLKKEYTELNDSLNLSRTELNQNNRLLDNKQALLQEKTVAIDNLAELISKNKALLKQQQDELLLSQSRLEQQQAELTAQSSTIKNQATALYGSIILLLSIGITIIVIYRGFKLKQKSNEALEKKNQELGEINHQLSSTQNQLVEAEKMAALGGLVAGVAHEINTPIGVGVTSASHLLDSVKSFKQKFQTAGLKRSELESLLDDLSESGEILQRNLNRASGLIKSFKKVSTDQTSEEIREFGVNQYLGEICQNLHYKLKQKHHKVKLNCDDAIRITTYPGTFAQVFTNLIVNSIIHGFGDAISNGEISIDVEASDKALLIIYQDSGKGIPDAVIDKIFDPFFTTNRAQGGSGLGLHICYNLVTQSMKGRIGCVKSDKGARFEIELPLTVV